MTDHFIDLYSSSLQKTVKGVTNEAMAKMQNYSWPGNVRELENTIERAINFTSSDMISTQDLPEHLIRSDWHRPQETEQQAEDTSEQNGTQTVEYKELLELLSRHHGNVKEIAELKGIPLSTLYVKLTRYNIRAKDFKAL